MILVLNPHRLTRRDKTAELRRVGDVNWILGDLKLSSTKNLKTELIQTNSKTDRQTYHSAVATRPDPTTV